MTDERKLIANWIHFLNYPERWKLRIAASDLYFTVDMYHRTNTRRKLNLSFQLSGARATNLTFWRAQTPTGGDIQVSEFVVLPKTIAQLARVSEKAFKVILDARDFEAQKRKIRADRKYDRRTAR